jgi:hypothetical protein
VLRGVTAELMLLVISLAFIVAWSVALRAQWRARQLTP